MRVAFLGYGRRQTRLIGALETEGCSVHQTAEPVGDLAGSDCVVSFGFKHIIKARSLATAQRPILNLHISMLPYNRGYHPNFWAHIDGTPHGVTIHEIDQGVDTGPIAFQREVVFEPHLSTFSATYRKLIWEVEDLFIANMAAILANDYEPVPQTGQGSFHRKAELPAWMTDWDMRIDEAKARFAAEADRR